MKIAGVHKTSLVDGYGVNYVIFFQGCPHDCEGCQNPSTHDPDGGYEITVDEIMADIDACGLITGVTFSGGEPLEQLPEVLKLLALCKKRGLSTTLYTGYTALNDVDRLCFRSLEDFRVITYPDTDMIDYIIDGKYDCSQRSYDTPFRGSRNQRLLIHGVDY